MTANKIHNRLERLINSLTITENQKIFLQEKANNMYNELKYISQNQISYWSTLSSSKNSSQYTLKRFWNRESFESFLNSLPETHMNILIVDYLTIDLSKLPKEMQITYVFKILDRAMKINFGATTKKIDRIIDIKSACRIILKDQINSNAFILGGKNPRPDVISNCFKIIGKSKIFIIKIA